MRFVTFVVKKSPVIASANLNFPAALRPPRNDASVIPSAARDLTFKKIHHEAHEDHEDGSKIFVCFVIFVVKKLYRHCDPGPEPGEAIQSVANPGLPRRPAASSQ